MNEIIKTKYSDRVEYTLNGKLHREDGPAIEYADGDKEWYLYGLLHREDGPSQEYFGGTKLWYFKGKLHRVDGPAIECADGTKQYWVNGERLDFITNDQMLSYYLKYGFLS